MSGIGKILVIAAFVLLVALGFVFLRGQSSSPLDGARSILEVQDKVIVYHTYLHGIHAYAGSVNAPSPCFDISQDVAIAESYPEQISIQLTSDQVSEYCIQMITPIHFAVTAPASGEAGLVAVYLDGQALTYDIMEDPLLSHIPAELFDGVVSEEELELYASTTKDEMAEEGVVATSSLETQVNDE